MSPLIQPRNPRRRLRGPAVGEIALTATLLSLYASCRGTARVIAALEAVVSR
jgi:hypothetical protein